MKKTELTPSEAVIKYLEDNPPLELDNSSMQMLQDKLVLISQHRSFLMKLFPVGIWSRLDVPDDYIVIDEYLYKIEEIIDFYEESERFVQELTRPGKDVREWYFIYLDGKLVHKTLSGGTWTKQRNLLLKARKEGKLSFDIMKMVDPEYKVTYFTFEGDDPEVRKARRKKAKASKAASAE